MKHVAFLLLALLAFVPSVARAMGDPPPALAELGLPFYLDHFSPVEYGAHPQNWAITQDDRGVVYAGNYDGILEYDGVSWRLIPTRNSAIVRSLAVGPDGTVYAGTQDDFGYLAPDSTGASRYVSLIDHVAAGERNFRDVWGVHVTAEGVFFQTSSRLFLWDGKSIEVWHSENGFHTSFVVDGRLYVREIGTGLMEMVGGSLWLVSDGARFADERVFAMVPLPQGDILIGTWEGLYVFDGETVILFETEVDEYLQAHRLYHGTALPGGHVALAMLDGGGVAVLDADGRLMQLLTEKNGLPDGWVNFVFADAQGGLWAALNNEGLVHVDAPSALTRFGSEQGIDGLVTGFMRYEGDLFVATTSGLFRLQEAQREAGRWRAARFDRIAADEIRSARAVVADSTGLYLTTDEGVFVYREGAARMIYEGKAFALTRSEALPGRLYVGTKDGLIVLDRTAAGWEAQRVGNSAGEIYGMSEEDDGTLWVSTRDKHVMRLDFAGHPYHPRVERLDPPQTMTQSDIAAMTLDGEVAFASTSGIYRYGPGDCGDRPECFYRDEKLTADLHVAGDTLLAISELRERIYLFYTDHAEIVVRRDGVVVGWETPEELRFPAWQPPMRAWCEEDGVVWVGSGSMLLRYEPGGAVAKPYRVPFSALVRRVTTVDTGELVYGGMANRSEAGMPALSSARNAVRIDYAAPSFNDAGATRFQYRLEGRDEAWSDWSRATSKNYTNLWEGRYVFHVRARNAQGVTSRVGTFSFVVRPPWYRSWWAYAFYALGLTVLAFYGVRYRRMVRAHRRAQKHVEELARERVVNERLHQLNARLHEANESLRQADRLKDEFLANTSHELRTPLAGILGFAKILKEEIDRVEHVEFLDFIEENGERLMKTLDALLELARLRAGMVDVERTKLDVGVQTAEVAQAYVVQAARKGLALEVSTPAEPVFGWLDSSCLEGVLNNLIGNAIKFTEAGRIDVVVTEADGRVRVTVRDTGIGIDAQFIPHLFDEFKQESSGLARSYEGSGLGLAVTNRLVELMGGDVEVKSVKGEGSTFAVSFPVYSPEFAALDGGDEALAGDGLPEHLAGGIRFTN